MLSQDNLVVLRVKCLGYIDQRQTSVLPSIQGQNCLIRLQIVSYNPEGEGGALKERFDRGVSPLPSNPDSVFKAAHD